MIQTHARAFIHEGRRPTRMCEFAGCTHATREHKPFCSDHVEHHPYVQAIINRNANDDALVTDDVG